MVEPVQDRIRRILSDAGGGLRRAAEVPPPPPGGPGEGLDESPRGLRDRLLRRRLDALRVAQTTPSYRPAAERAALPTVRFAHDDDDRPLEAIVGGVERETDRGRFLFVERRWRLDDRHGQRPLRAVTEHALPLRRTERGPGPPARVDPRAAVYLDVETTGLAGGTGTVAFLVGAARVEGDDLVVRQYFMRDFPEEGALLRAFAADLGDAPLVTFNGRSFDWPLLTTRLRLHREPVADRPHLDLLPPARRLWAGSLASHSLGDLERSVLGVEREDDLPGWLIPDAWFTYLRTNRAARVAAAFRHNEWDIVSMAALGAEVGRVLEDPASRPHAPAADHLGAARLLLDQGEPERARACLEAAIDGARAEPSPSLRRLLGQCRRRAGDIDGAMRAWTSWLEAERGFDPHPFEELAKACEHRRRDLTGAIAWVDAALARCPRAHPGRAGLEHRAARLRRRLARAGGPAPARR